MRIHTRREVNCSTFVFALPSGMPPMDDPRYAPEKHVLNCASRAEEQPEARSVPTENDLVAARYWREAKPSTNPIAVSAWKYWTITCKI